MFKKICSVSYVILMLGWASSVYSQLENQKIKVVKVEEAPDLYATFPKLAEETSGLIWFGNALWTFNDSGGKPEIYKIDSLGAITQKVQLMRAKNIDWEDITQDEESIFIGDFGNNWGNRTDLIIYRISKADIVPGESIQVIASPIAITFADQDDFSIRNRKHDFDCESMISYGDSLILFSKNWIDGKTRMYKLAKTTGRFPVEPLAEFNADGLVTGASYNPENGLLALIGYKDFVPFIWIIENFDGRSFQSERITRFDLVGITHSQTEGICWMSDGTLLISTEQREQYQQGAYVIDIIKMLNNQDRK